MTSKKRGLGRGLDALLGDAQPAISSKARHQQTLPIEFLQRGKYQPRQEMDPQTLKELTNSIKAQGIIQPLVVRSIGDHKYEIIAGERRWRAAQLAALQEVPVVIKQLDDRNAMAVALIENIQREDLNALEEAEALSRLLSEFEMTHQQIANAVGKSRTAVSNLLRLLALPSEVKTLLAQGALEMGHARALLAVDGSQQIAIARQAVAQKLTVRAVEKRVKTGQPKQQPKPKPTDPDTLKLEQELTEKVGTKVTIVHKNNGKGRLIFDYTRLQELENIIARIK